MHSHLYFITYKFEHFFVNLYIVNPWRISAFSTHSLVLTPQFRCYIFFTSVNYIHLKWSAKGKTNAHNICVNAMSVVAILKSNFIHNECNKIYCCWKWFYGKYKNKIELIEKCAHCSMQRLMDIGSPPFPQKIKCANSRERERKKKQTAQLAAVNFCL